MSGRTWHSRPVIAPLVYGAGNVVSGGLGYATGYLLTERMVAGIVLSLVMNALLTVYWILCHRESLKGESWKRSWNEESTYGG